MKQAGHSAEIAALASTNVARGGVMSSPVQRNKVADQRPVLAPGQDAGEDGPGVVGGPRVGCEEVPPFEEDAPNAPVVQRRLRQVAELVLHRPNLARVVALVRQAKLARSGRWKSGSGKVVADRPITSVAGASVTALAKRTQ